MSGQGPGPLDMLLLVGIALFAAIVVIWLI
jgi:hypothetical protein